MASTGPQVLEKLLASGKSRAIALLAYGLFGEQKANWESHEKSKSATGQRPQRGQIDAWISTLTPMDFERWLREADELLAPTTGPLAEMRRVGKEIVANVESANSFIKQLRLAVVTTILSPIIIGGMIGISVGYDKLTPIWTDLEKKLHDVFLPKAEAKPPELPK